jgi:hypothetical protein
MLMLTCATCCKPLIETEDYAILTSTIFAAHSSDAHGNHTLVLSDGLPIHTLKVQCVDERCLREPKTREWTCEKPMIAAYVVAFHASHEGHPLVLSLDGMQFFP